jgi:enamine deaminase RidA (YjgF/YER057c/UK114 family)
MTGMEILLKSMGFDPSEMKAKIEDAQNKATQVLKHFDERLNVIERKQDEILKHFQETKNDG